MFERIVRFAVERRLLVLAASILLLIQGVISFNRTPVGVLPDFNRPVVTIFSEAPGMAPEEVETLVTLPLESAVSGATAVQRVRSISGIGLAITFVEFDWGTEIYVDRQIVAERLQGISASLPEGITPVLGPITSIMGSISLIGFRSKTGETPASEIRTLVDWVVRPRLQAVPGVSQVINLGGGVKQYQVLVSPPKLRQFGVTLQEVEDALAGSNQNTSGGYLDLGDREYVVRNLGRIESLEDIQNTIVSFKSESPVYVQNVAVVRVGTRPQRGDAGVDGEPAVIANVFIQPGASITGVNAQVEEALVELRPALPANIEVDGHLFRQASFIEAAVANMKSALIHSSLLVIIVLPIFLLNFRTTLITITTIPVSFVFMLLWLDMMGMTVNTMTLGGLALAVGELVDDAIVGVENVYRRLRENRQKELPQSPLQIVRDATIEVRAPILYSTYLVCLIFIPLLFLSGVEARIFMPLGIAFILSIVASTVVAVTITPALCAYLLPASRLSLRESPLSLWLKKIEAGVVRFALSRVRLVPILAGLGLLLSVALVPFMGLEFLPPFSEGSLTVNVLAEPGTSLAESNRIGVMAERLLLQVPEVTSTGRRTGRAELDDHAEEVYYTEIDVGIESSGRVMEEISQDIRTRLSAIPGVSIAVGQPISHKIDHLLSGISAQVAVKIFGPDLEVLRDLAQKTREQMARVAGVVDLQVETQTRIPQLQIKINRQAAALYGVSPGDINHLLETYLQGRVVSRVLEGQRSFDLFVRVEDSYVDDLQALQDLPVDTSRTEKVPLKQLADIRTTEGPNQILRENGQRRIVVQCNVAGRDLGSTVTEMQQRLAETIDLPAGYFLLFGGQFESQQRATRSILFSSTLVVIAIFILLLYRFGSVRVALLIMVNLPLAAIGSVLAVFWSGGVLSVGSLIGFIAVCSIASRTSLMLLSHFIHLMEFEGEVFGDDLVVRGAVERVVPVMMTASTTALGLLPLLLAQGEAGKEILYPVAVVLMGGLISSTLLVMVVVPVLFRYFGQPVWQRIEAERGQRLPDADLATSGFSRPDPLLATGREKEKF